MGLKAAVQALKKAEELKARVSRHNDLLNNSEVWSDQQQLQTVYHQVLVLDLEYALDKKVEQELWTLGFKNHIAALQHLSRDKKNPKRSEYQALLSWCLEAASGFYLTLLQELCSAFELDLPFRRRGAVYGQTKYNSNSEQFTQPHKSSCLYICQYCLVHLGDIARYRSQRKQAESFYRHAILLSPSSGQPYNQLALLEASRGDKLATVFHYVRSISVKHPFPAAATNLSNTLSAVIDNDEPLTEIHSKLSLTDFVTIFLRVHGLLHLAADLDQAELCVKSLNATFTALVATQAFSSGKLIQMTAINLYALRHTMDSLATTQLTEDELRVKQLILDLLAGAFSAYLLPIYTMKNDASLLDYYALPAIKLTMDWIKTDPNVLKESVFTKRLQIWPSLCKLLNSLQAIVGDFDSKNYNKSPLPEDRDLQCFLPLVNAFKELDFAPENLNQDLVFFNKLRITRLVNLGLWITTQSVNSNVLITAKKLKNPTKVVFEPANKQPDPTTELLEELKHFNIKESSTNCVKESKKSPLKGALEKRGGILKPQGSLEKSREEREQALMLSTNPETCETISNTSQSNSSVCSSRSDTSKHKRNRQNVAMQALAKKVEENNKQVTFVTEPVMKAKEKEKSTLHSNNKSIDNTINTINKLAQDLPMPKINLSKNLPEIPEPIRMPLPIPMPGSSDLHPTANNYQNQTNMPIYPQNTYVRNTAMNVNVSNLPFSLPFPNPTSANNLPYHNTSMAPPPPANLPFPRQAPLHFNTNNLNTQNGGFGIANNAQSSSQNAGYHQKDQFSTWMHDEKLPMPPSSWWANSQKALPRPQFQNSDIFNSTGYSYNMNTNSGNNLGMLDNNLKTPNLDLNRQYNSTNRGNNSTVYNNMSLWNSGPNIQPNLQLLFNQPAKQQQMLNQQSFNDNQRETLCTTSDNQTNSPTIPGYSLFNSNWGPNLSVHSALKTNNSPPDRAPLMRQQSLFSGPGPSPLERLLEQQKQLRGAKEDT